MAESQLTFITDDQIAQRIQQVENGLLHLEHALPALRRELEALRKLVVPEKASARTADAP